MDAPAAFPLRPLGIGEIFDRAVTIYVRNFAVFTLIVLTLLVPLGIAQYAIFHSQSQDLAQLLQQMQHPEKTPAPPLSGGMLALYMLFALAAFVGAPFANTAVAVGVAALYRGIRPSYSASYATVLRRWAPLLGTALLDVLVIGGCYLAGAIVLGFIVGFGAVLISVALPVAVTFFVIAIVGFVALLLFMVVLIIAYAFATYSTSLEMRGPVAAIGGSFARIFNRREWKKALLMGLAYIGLQLGVLMLSGSIGLLATMVLKSYALQVAINTILGSILTAFLTTLLAVYYFDVRTRSEGLDLEVDIARLTATP